jgi:uncharacterized protein YjeT (DUF2065 family)
VISGKRDELLDSVRTRMNEDAKQIGAEVIDVRLKRVDFAPEVSERVFDRMQSERKRVANERRATGAAESEKIRADADRQRDVIVAEAYRDAQRVKGEGDAKASALFADAFGQNPEFASFYRSPRGVPHELPQQGSTCWCSTRRPSSSGLPRPGTAVPGARQPGASKRRGRDLIAALGLVLTSAAVCPSCHRRLARGDASNLALETVRRFMGLAATVVGVLLLAVAGCRARPTARSAPMPRWLLPESISDILPTEARRIEDLRRRLLDLYRTTATSW